MTADSALSHNPVMLAEMLGALDPKNGARYLDATFGAGGYTRAILDAADCSVIAIDRDPDAIKRADGISADYGDRFTILCGCFGDMEQLLLEIGVTRLDGIVMDFGLSSPQIDNPVRGFSFRADGPLDMRMGMTGPSAADVVNEWPESELARIIKDYGEERYARRVARAIVTARTDAPIETTAALATIVRSAVPRSKDGIDPATRTFQALRIEVNDELGEIDRALEAAENLLAPEGRLVVVAFHSLEDRRVKAFLAKRSGRGGGGSRHLPQKEPAPPTFTLLPGGLQKPTEAEIRLNPRSRSARLRAAVRNANTSQQVSNAVSGGAS